MHTSDRTRVVFHGAVIVFVGLLCGYPTVSEGEVARLWHTAHEGLILIGVMMLAISSAMPVLSLERREARGLVWSLLATGYGFMTGLLIEGVTGAHAFGPSRSPVLMVAFVGNATGVLGSMLAAGLTIVGARAARRASMASSPAA